jgi:hypothetical protein
MRTHTIAQPASATRRAMETEDEPEGWLVVMVRRYASRVRKRATWPLPDMKFL